MTEYNLPQAMRQPRMKRSMTPRFPASAIVFLLLLLVATAHASERLDSQISMFAKKIAAISGPATATLEIRNLSTLPAEQAAAMRRSLELQLRAAGVQLRPEREASVGIRVTLSENRRGWLWIAEVQQGTETRVTMLEVAEERSSEANASALPMTLRSSLLLSTSDVLLDAQPLETPRGTLAALTTRAVVLYEQQNGRWQPVRELPLPLQVTSPQVSVSRDPRGRIVPAADHPFHLYFSGGNCAAARDKADISTLTAIALSCVASDDPWPLGGEGAVYNPARNYFTALLVHSTTPTTGAPGTLAPGAGRALPPFYSAAPISQGNSTFWVLAGVDGRVSAFDGTNERQLGGAARDWGSDIAALHSGCGGGVQLLATGNGATEGSDSLQAFEIAGRDPIAITAPLKFDGSITALWGVPGAAAATAVVHTLKGGYDAYSVSLDCGR